MFGGTVLKARLMTVSSSQPSWRPTHQSTIFDTVGSSSAWESSALDFPAFELPEFMLPDSVSRSGFPLGITVCISTGLMLHRSLVKWKVSRTAWISSRSTDSRIQDCQRPAHGPQRQLLQERVSNCPPLPCMDLLPVIPCSFIQYAIDSSLHMLKVARWIGHLVVRHELILEWCVSGLARSGSFTFV